jgi:hypothetical protein
VVNEHAHLVLATRWAGLGAKNAGFGSVLYQKSLKNCGER